MSRKRSMLPVARRYAVNDLDIFDANFWIREAMLAMEPALIVAPLVTQDFRSDGEFKLGDIASIPKIGSFKALRKEAVDDNTDQDVTSDSVQIPLDQYLHVTFLIRDGEDKKPAMSLVDTYMVPAARALASAIDRICAGQHVRFWEGMCGGLGKGTTSTIMGYAANAAMTLDRRGVSAGGRALIMGPTMKTVGMQTPNFVNAYQSGTNQTLRTGQLGGVYGFDTFMSMNISSPVTGQAMFANAAAALATNGAFGAGTTVLTVAGTAAATTEVGMFVSVAGDDLPQRVTARDATHLTIWPGLKTAVLTNAVISVVAAGAVNLAAGYRGTTWSDGHRTSGWSKYIASDGWTTAPQVGQPVCFGGGTEVYTLIDVVNTAAGAYNLLLDRPLVAALTNDQTINLAPAGEYNLAVVRNSVAFVNRALALPRPSTGVNGAILANPNIGVTLRAVVTYDGKAGGHRVTLDTLCGVAVAEPKDGTVILF